MVNEARTRLAVTCRMALIAWRSNIIDVQFRPLYEQVDWPTSQDKSVDDEDLATVLHFASYLGDAVNHGGPPLRGLAHEDAMVELEKNIARLESGESLTDYAKGFAR